MTGIEIGVFGATALMLGIACRYYWLSKREKKREQEKPPDDYKPLSGIIGGFYITRPDGKISNLQFMIEEHLPNYGFGMRSLLPQGIKEYLETEQWNDHLALDAITLAGFGTVTEVEIVADHDCCEHPEAYHSQITLNVRCIGPGNTVLASFNGDAIAQHPADVDCLIQEFLDELIESTHNSLEARGQTT